MITSYHNHTDLSDGSATLGEMIAGARAAGLDEFGISDHYVLDPRQQHCWSMPADGLDAYVANLQQAARETTDLTLRIGVEADFFPETVAELRSRLAAQPFDYVIGSVHIVNGFHTDEDAGYWEPLSPKERDEVWRWYWIRLRELAESRVFDIVGHLDLPKKFGYRPTVDLSAESAAALDAIAAAGMSIEINTAGWHKPINEAYPSADLLRAACRRGIPLVINADAHAPQDVACDFARARELAARAGYTERVRYERRRRFPVPL